MLLELFCARQHNHHRAISCNQVLQLLEKQLHDCRPSPPVVAAHQPKQNAQQHYRVAAFVDEVRQFLSGEFLPVELLLDEALRKDQAASSAEQRLPLLTSHLRVQFVSDLLG